MGSVGVEEIVFSARFSAGERRLRARAHQARPGPDVLQVDVYLHFFVLILYGRSMW